MCLWWTLMGKRDSSCESSHSYGWAANRIWSRHSQRWSILSISAGPCYFDDGLGVYFWAFGSPVDSLVCGWLRAEFLATAQCSWKTAVSGGEEAARWLCPRAALYWAIRERKLAYRLCEWWWSIHRCSGVVSLVFKWASCRVSRSLVWAERFARVLASRGCWARPGSGDCQLIGRVSLSRLQPVWMAQDCSENVDAGCCCQEGGHGRVQIWLYTHSTVFTWLYAACHYATWRLPRGYSCWLRKVVWTPLLSQGDTILCRRKQDRQEPAQICAWWISCFWSVECCRRSNLPNGTHCCWKLVQIAKFSIQPCAQSLCVWYATESRHLAVWPWLLHQRGVLQSLRDSVGSHTVSIDRLSCSVGYSAVWPIHWKCAAWGQSARGRSRVAHAFSVTTGNPCFDLLVCSCAYKNVFRTRFTLHRTPASVSQPTGAMPLRHPQTCPHTDWSWHIRFASISQGLLVSFLAVRLSEKIETCVKFVSVIFWLPQIAWE